MMSKNLAKDYAKRDYESSYSPSTPVTLIRKKPNGYPKFLEFGVIYKVSQIENENLYLECPSNGHLKKIHFSYVMPVNVMRNIFINKFLEND